MRRTIAHCIPLATVFVASSASAQPAPTQPRPATAQPRPATAQPRRPAAPVRPTTPATATTATANPTATTTTATTNPTATTTTATTNPTATTATTTATTTTTTVPGQEVSSWNTTATPPTSTTTTTPATANGVVSEYTRPDDCTGPKVGKIEFEGLNRVVGRDLRSSIRVSEGACYDRTMLQRDARSLWDLGFFRDVQVASDPDADGTITIKFTLAEKPIIHQIKYKGNENLEEDKIKEVVELREGQSVSEGAIRRAAQRIQDSYAEKGYFLAEVRGETVESGDKGTEIDVVFTIKENAQVQVRSIQFVGNHNISDDELRGVMSTGTGGFFSFLTNAGTYREDAFKSDIELLHAAYYDRGYLNVQIDSPRVSLTADRRYLDITMFVREGPRYRVGRVTVRELDDNDEEIEPLGGAAKVRALIHAVAGEYFSRTTIARDILALQTYYRDLGYASVEVRPEPRPNVDGSTVEVEVNVKRGLLTTVDRIVVRGNVKTADRVVRRELALMEGDRYSETLYQESRRRVMQLGYFERVDMSTEPVPDHPDRIIVNVEVVERPTGTFQLGAGFSSVEQFILTGQIQQLNLFGRGQSFSGTIQWSAYRQIFQLRFVEPYLFDSLWSGSVDVYNTLRVYSDFTRYATGGSIATSYPLIGTNDLRLGVTYTGEMVNVNTRGFGVFNGSGLTQQSSFASLPLANLFRNGFTSSLGVSLTLDTRDNRLFPTSGVFARVGLDVADPYTGSQNTYARWTANLQFYLPLFAGVVFRSRFNFGAITSRDPRGVQIAERFFLGGILDVRGYRMRTIGPRLPVNRFNDPNSDVVANGGNIGGNIQGYYNLEVEFPIIDKIGVRGVIFHDAGNVWNTEAQYCNAAQGSYQPGATDVINPCVTNPLSLRTSVGVGLRWMSPLGLLRFEWGFPLNRLAFEEPNVFEFTIGNFF